MKTFCLYLFVLMVAIDVWVLLFDLWLLWTGRMTITQTVVTRRWVIFLLLTGQMVGIVALALHLLLP